MFGALRFRGSVRFCVEVCGGFRVGVAGRCEELVCFVQFFVDLVFRVVKIYVEKKVV